MHRPLGRFRHPFLSWRDLRPTISLLTRGADRVDDASSYKLHATSAVHG
jgi:hypothetical protein